jgi:hypothetical protein
MQHQALGRPRKHGLGGLSLQFEPHGVVARKENTMENITKIATIFSGQYVGF